MSQTLIVPKYNNSNQNARIEALDTLLENAGASLDIPPSKHADAVNKYQAVGNFLGKAGTLLAIYEPLIYVQGSISTGTAVKPIGSDEFDIDLVCLFRNPLGLTYEQLSNLVGIRLREDATYAAMLEQKKRCWRLKYAGDFHMDITPAKPDGRIEDAIYVSDMVLKCFKPSHPKGFATWFEKQSLTSIQNFSATTEQLEAKGEVEEAPEHDRGRKRPLQRAIQILKRHRDLSFASKGQDYMPISAIITTLAAKCQIRTDSILNSMKFILQQMPNHLERDGSGIAHVRNPKQQEEDYADKWRTSQRYESEFQWWLQLAMKDLTLLESASGQQNVVIALEALIGHRRTKLVMEADALHTNNIRKNSRLGINLASGTLGLATTTSSAVPKNTFYGS